jgi:bifunctional UDP-N-acetylglucosamine pyrophosphorylase / glucosamine-1-phosphate N-acetyltransferase
MQPKVQAVILAAGKSSRFNTGTTKLSVTLCGQEMIAYPAQLLASLNIPQTYVVGFQKQTIQAIVQKYIVSNLTFIEQENQLGTGHALLCSQPAWRAENILVLNGDIPLLTREIIDELCAIHEQQQAAVSFVTTLSNDLSAQGLGRVIKHGSRIKIVEARNSQGEDFTQLPLNAGIYLFKKSFLEETLSQLTPNEKTGEIYITDLIEYASNRNLTVATTLAPFDYVRGVNTLKELWAAEHIKRSEILTYWMDHGVRFAAALNVCIDLDVEIGAGTFIGTGAVLTKGTRIGKNCIVNAFSYLSNTIVHDNVDIKPHSAICNSIIRKGAQVGPFAHLNDSDVKENVIIGNFVELKNSNLVDENSPKNLSYVEDSKIRNNINV